MSEHAKQHNQLHNTEHHVDNNEHEQRAHEALRQQHEREQKKHDTDQVKEAAQHEVNKHAQEANNLKHQHEQQPTEHHHYLTKSVKNAVYSQTMANVQTHLKPAERRFSKLVHNSSVEAVSELGARTVAQPNAILGGGLLMSFGGLAIILVARHYGFEVPLSLFMALYVIGFVLTLLLLPLKRVSTKFVRRIKS